MNKSLLIGFITGFLFTGSLVYYKANDFLTAPKVDVLDLTTVKLDSTSYQMSEVKDKHLIVNLWATWCAPCIKEMPYLFSLTEQLDPEDWQIILVSDEELEEIHKFREKHDIRLSMLKSLDSFKDFGIKAYPTTYVISKEGQIVFRRNGELQLFQQEFERSVNELNETGSKN